MILSQSISNKFGLIQYDRSSNVMLSMTIITLNDILRSKNMTTNKTWASLRGETKNLILPFIIPHVHMNFSLNRWYVSNVSIIYEVFMLLFYHFWMFYNHFISTLYHFLGLTYWPSAQCQLLFFCLFFTSRKINIKWSPNTVKLFEDFYGLKHFQWARVVVGGAPRGGHPTMVRLGPQERLGGLCPSRWPPTPPLYPINSQKFQKP